MKKKVLTEKLISEFQSQIPDEYDQILLKCQNSQKERKVNMPKEKKKISLGLSLALAACFLLLISGGTLFYNYSLNSKVDSIIGIDVNPSIELQVNKKEKIVNYTALNDDAKNILGDMDLKDVDIDIALNAIIGSMVTKGYIDELANSILISVDNKDATKAEELRQKLVTKIDNILNTDKIQGSVLSQTINSKNQEMTEAEKMADKYDISVGKAKLILEVLAKNSLLREEDLVDLTINEINVLTQSKNNSLTTVTKQGNASTKSYIGEEKAKSIALNHAGVTKTTKMEVEFDADEGVLIYDVEFETTTYEYDYEINALDGTILSSHKERNDDYPQSNNNNNNNNSNSNNPTTNNSNNNNTQNSKFISRDKAKSIALNHAKVSNPQQLEIELDADDNEYSVEFEYNGQEYDYEINATTGKIVDYDIERID